MSNNPQWKTFQPPIMNSDPAILDYKSMSIPTKSIVGGTQSSNSNYRNGTNYGGELHGYMGSPPDSGKNSYTSGYSPASGVTLPRNGTARLPSRSLSMENSNPFTPESPSTNNSSYQDQSGNQGPREAGIIEKLLVISYFNINETK